MTDRPTLAKSPILEDSVERALAEFRALIPPSMEAEYRKLLLLGLAAHSSAQEIVKRLRPRADVQESAWVATPQADAAPDDRKKGGEGER